MPSQPTNRADVCVIELRRMLEEMLGENFVRLYHYGSRVEGTASPDADYDVLCVTRRSLSPEELDRVIDRSLDIQIAHDAVFDLHFYTEDELDSPPLSYTPFVRRVKRSAVLV